MTADAGGTASTAPIGLLVNPRAGTDIRRAVAAAGKVTLEEKINVVRRVVLGARESGATRFVVHHDPHRIVRRATETIRGIDLQWVGGALTGTEQDSIDSVTAMRSAGCAVVVVLGGDGTNRAAALAWPDLVVVPLSTGTNNAFPVFVEATIAGAAAGHLAVGRVPLDGVAPRAKVVRLRLEGGELGVRGDEPGELALVDAVAVDDPFVGSYELFDPTTLRTAVLSRADPSVVGFVGTRPRARSRKRRGGDLPWPRQRSARRRRPAAVEARGGVYRSRGGVTGRCSLYPSARRRFISQRNLSAKIPR